MSERQSVFPYTDSDVARRVRVSATCCFPYHSARRRPGRHLRRSIRFFRDRQAARGIQLIGCGLIRSCLYNGIEHRLGFEELRRMVQITEKAVSKVREIMSSQEPAPAGLRIAVVGGGCSGFSYSMAFENQPNMLDKTYKFGDLHVFIDQASLLYLDGAEVDFLETLEGSGFKFNNPQVKSTCGCGSSFQV